MRKIRVSLALAGICLMTACGSKAASTSKSADKVAGSEDMTTVEAVLEDGMTPVKADELKDGTYEVEMKSSSSMFKTERCELTVGSGKLSVTLHMSSEAYSYLYNGTAAEAAASDESQRIALGADKTFVLPVEALDAEVRCAAFSKRKEMWYDRTLLFRADSLPEEAFAEGALKKIEDLGLSDGNYSVDVTLSGGSGKASIQSPALFEVKDGKATVEIRWNSRNYDYMIVDGEKITGTVEGDQSVFIIPLSLFDRPVAVKADTTAMSTPHEIEYTLTFASESIAEADADYEKAA